jgi:hypothetical protein
VKRRARIMNGNLVINPFLQLSSSNEEDADFFLIVPKLQAGLQKLKISKSEQPNLYELFLEFSQTSFELLSIQYDLDDTEREFLYQSGVLVESENVPQKTLFACHLDEVETKVSEIDTASLIVNPTFRFEPFDFANYVSWVHEKHVSPHQSSVWLKQPVTEIEIGYWLNNDQAETISKFTAGEKLSSPVDPELLSKLAASRILTTAEMLSENECTQREALEQAKIKYNRDKYVVLRELLPPAQMKAMRRYYRQYVSQGFMPFDDSQSKRFYQHNEPLARLFHGQLAKLMSAIVGEEVIPSYVYAASYIENADLKPHIDRAQCEFSISFQIDYLPEPENHLSPWALFVYEPDFSNDQLIKHKTGEFPARNENEDKNTAIYLASGDGLIYKGRELIHYRYALPDGHQSTSLFFHYVSKDFEGELT